MSSEFTIDIQLTELGFPELFQDEARSKEAPSHPCPSDSSCAPLTPPNSQTASPPSQELNSDNVAGGHVLPIASKPAMARNRAPAQKVAQQSDQNKDQSNPGANVADGNRTGVGSNSVRRDTERNVSITVRKKPEPATGLNHVRAVGARGVGKSSGGDGGGKEQGVNANNKRPAAEADQDSEETEDSDISEEEDEEEEDNEEEDDDEEEIASDASADGLAEHCCRVCGLSLPSAFQLREHMHLHSGARPYRCAECGKQFCHLANYRAHLRGHAHARTPSARCRVCEASFDSEESLAHHLENSHFEKEFYQCDFCKRVFTCLTECQRHVDTHRREPRRHQCPRCQRHFRRRKSLARHMERHAARRSYLCTDCGQAFDRKNVLFRHSFSHLGLLPYTCVRCRRHFRLASLYRGHACEPQRIQCEACLGFFRSQEDFQRHKEETGCWGHQGARPRGGDDAVRCMECGQAFGSSEELRCHGSAHQRVLTCSECGKGFRSALLLMSHMGGHAGQRPCLCQRCGLGFPHQQGYDGHREHCGRPPPAPVAPKKQKKEAPAPEKVDVPPRGVWKLTLDKCPPPGASLVMFLPVPADSSSPGLADFAAGLPVGSLPASNPQTQAPALQVAMGSGSARSVQGQPSTAAHQPPAMAAVVEASTAGQGQPSEAACQESLPVPGTTLKLQISKATFVPGPQKLPETWEQSGILQPAPAGDGAQPSGTALPRGTAGGPARPPQVTMQIVGAPGAGGLFSSAAAGGARREGRGPDL
ncbi:hypothetical protein ANANG_G00005460 [Anguilla anguilla]|uniref:C2H2-type domain-containing protein n=1 Tax=Anguilla anguilla TaxID=7936 RepID=A0A9D3MZJ3_ANGAN|nr:hypothetical protein ANANG_G00005460 [Anguilla anguilla]